MKPDAFRATSGRRWPTAPHEIAPLSLEDATNVGGELVRLLTRDRRTNDVGCPRKSDAADVGDYRAFRHGPLSIIAAARRPDRHPPASTARWTADLETGGADLGYQRNVRPATPRQ